MVSNTTAFADTFVANILVSLLIPSSNIKFFPIAFPRPTVHIYCQSSRNILLNNQNGIFHVHIVGVLYFLQMLMVFLL